MANKPREAIWVIYILVWGSLIDSPPAHTRHQAVFGHWACKWEGPRRKEMKEAHFTALLRPRPEGTLWDSQGCWPPRGTLATSRPCSRQGAEQSSVPAEAWMGSESTDPANREATWPAWAAVDFCGIKSYPGSSWISRDFTFSIAFSFATKNLCLLVTFWS